MALKKTVLKKDEIEKVKCLKCGKLKSPNTSNFYANTNQLFSSDKLEVCKDCILHFIGEKGSEGYKDRAIVVLAMLDKPFVDDLWTQMDQEWSKFIPPLSSFPKFRGLKFSDSSMSSIGSSNANIKKSNIDDEENNQEYFDDEEKFFNRKWMGEYTNSDIDYMEDYYLGLDRDFKIVTTNHKDYARKICKASLHMDRCFQDVLKGVGGADAKYKSARETFDTLSKSAQFSESQRGQNDVSLGCFGVTFDQVEQKKWVPKHVLLDEDSYDKMLNQFATIKDSV
ncbi:hypothetical protein [Paenibacillus donghaensis]|uniref:Uncharacterized protein n=1 Tax=Paenibacillus donghaensis TaxID=414771 RepID=A0A2Z2KAS8_9BACL|nr:hypothetical protein [Paenibacillus donghaensis]ASA22744.1 hypothetical protein B9T62_19245 [Paenibacillus donghaensis]